MRWLVVAALVCAAPAVVDAKPRKKKAAPAKKEAPPPEPEIEFAPEPAPPPAEPAPEPAAVAPIDEPAGSDASVRAGSGPITTPPKRFYVRAGIVHVAPLAQSNEMELADIEGPASLAVQNGPIAGSGAAVNSATTFAAILGYRLNRKLAIETIIGVPFTVKFRATGTLANESIAPMALGIPTGVPALGEELGEAKALPPVLTLVYTPREFGPTRPYVGAGLGMMFATDAKVTNPLLTEVNQPAMEIPPSAGLVLQGGLDATLYKRIYARVDVKFIAFMKATAEVHHVLVRTPELPLFDTVEVGTAKMSMWLNPLIVQAGIGTDF